MGGGGNWFSLFNFPNLAVYSLVLLSSLSLSCGSTFGIKLDISARHKLFADNVLKTKLIEREKCYKPCRIRIRL